MTKYVKTGQVNVYRKVESSGCLLMFILLGAAALGGLGLMVNAIV